jgi:peptide/nickel transport system permease protein
LRYILRRLGFFVFTLWACITINFVVPRLMPGNPATAMMARYKGSLSPQALKAIEIAFGVNTTQSAFEQYFHYLGNVLTGNFGISLSFFPRPVTTVVAEALPWTLGLVGVTTVIAFVIGTFIGMVSAWRRGSWFDNLLPPLLIITAAFPYFFVAIVCLLTFAVRLGWLPESFGYSTGMTPSLSWAFAFNVVQHAILPALTIVITSIGGWVLTMRNNMITTLSEEYVRIARGKGLSPMRVMLDYAGRNAILPNLTGFAISLGFVVSGAILVEYVFAYPGVGYMLLEAVQNEDYALMQALFLVITVAVLVAVLMMDLLTVVVDPRARASR